jgi:hypothetical protein
MAEVTTRPGRSSEAHAGIGTTARLTPAQVIRTADRVLVLMLADKERRSAEHFAKRIGLGGVALEQVLRAIEEDEA